MGSRGGTHLVFIDDDPEEIHTFKRLYEGGGLLTTCVLVETAQSAGVEVEAALKGAIPDLFVLDMYIPFPGKPKRSFGDFSQAELREKSLGLDEIKNMLEKLGSRLLAGPIDEKALLRNTHAVVHRARTLLDDWCRLLNQSRSGGLEIMAQLGRKYPNTPIVFYSRKATLKDAKEALGAGAVDVIAKPDPSTELQEAREIRELFIDYSGYKPPQYIAGLLRERYGVELGWNEEGPVVRAKSKPN